MRDQLTCLTARASEACAVHDVVETRLEDAKQVLAGLAGAVVRLLVVQAELLLHDAVGEASLLLLLQLEQVLALLDTRAAVLSGRVRATLECLVASNEVDAQTTRLAGDGSGITCHFLLPILPAIPDAAWADGSRCAAGGLHRKWCRPRGQQPGGNGLRSRDRIPVP